ncbi:permease [Deferribacter thermophilus]|uniref:permease n=1 Tax=Deferribacter thermophilus TaxID=53573 RepID=UPI003C18BF0A
MKNNLIIPTIIMASLAAFLIICAYFNKEASVAKGFNISFNMFKNIIPLLVFAFIIAGFVQVLVPKEFIVKFFGEGSGLKGIIAAAIAGALTPGGPYVSFPLALSLMEKGASIGAMVSFVTAWSIWGVARLPLEVGILGLKFTVLRVVSTIFFPILAGIIANFINGLLK